MDVRGIENSVDQLMAAVTDYDRAKKMLCVEVVGAEQNADMLVTNLLMDSSGVPEELREADIVSQMYVLTNEDTVKGAAAAFYLEERLTDSVYHFDAESRTFELGEKYEHRMATREHERQTVSLSSGICRTSVPTWI